MPYPYGGKQRQVQVDLDPDALRAQGLSGNDVINAIGTQNSDPAGRHARRSATANTSSSSTPARAPSRSSTICRSAPATARVIYVRDVAHVRDGYPPQTNIVRVTASAPC